MKRIALILMIAAFGLQFTMAQDQAVEKDPVKWSEKSHDFGQIKLKVPATATFSFENTSEAPLVVTNVRTSCGCTVANYTKEPVRPGEKGEVSATYNAAKPGKFTKTVTVNIDGLAPIILNIRGEVVENLEGTTGEAGQE